MKKARQNRSVGVHPTALSRWWGDMEHREKISHAQKEVETAQKRLNASLMEESLSAAERVMLIEKADEDLGSGAEEVRS